MCGKHLHVYKYLYQKSNHTLKEAVMGLIRIVVIDITKVLGSEVYDEVIIPVEDAADYILNYTDMKRFRFITV